MRPFTLSLAAVASLIPLAAAVGESHYFRYNPGRESGIYSPPAPAGSTNDPAAALSLAYVAPGTSPVSGSTASGSFKATGAIDGASITATGLPTGVTLATDGTLTGTYGPAGTYSGLATVVDGRGRKAEAPFTIAVQPKPLVLASQPTSVGTSPGYPAATTASVDGSATSVTPYLRTLDGGPVPSWMRASCTGSTCTATAAPPSGTDLGTYPASSQFVLDLVAATGERVTTSGFQVAVRPTGQARDYRPVKVTGLVNPPANAIDLLYRGYADLVMDSTKTLTYTFDRAVTANWFQFQFTTVEAQPNPPATIALEAWNGSAWVNIPTPTRPGRPYIEWPYPLTAGSMIYPNDMIVQTTAVHWRMRLGTWPASQAGLFVLGNR